MSRAGAPFLFEPLGPFQMLYFFSFRTGNWCATAVFSSFSVTYMSPGRYRHVQRVDQRVEGRVCRELTGLQPEPRPDDVWDCLNRELAAMESPRSRLSIHEHHYRKTDIYEDVITSRPDVTRFSFVGSIWLRRSSYEAESNQTFLGGLIFQLWLTQTSCWASCSARFCSTAVTGIS